MYDDEDLPLAARDRQRLRSRPKQRKPRRKTRQALTKPAVSTVAGTVLEASPRSATVVLADGSTLAASLSGRLREQGEGLCVGDEVSIGIDEHGDASIQRVGPRRTLLVRTDPHVHQRTVAIVANVDAIGVVSSASDPPLRPRLLDRYLVAIGRSGARPVLVINKIDEATPERRLELDELLEPYASLGHPVHRVSAATGEGIPELVEELASERVAFVGHSGVGKSTLVTAMGASAAAGGLDDRGRGRHTTSSATLHRLASGIELIDTPGVRQFGLPNLTRRQLALAFADFEPFAPGCAYRSCSHVDEPDCAVRAAAEAGELSWARYDSYRRLLPE